ncbi:MULTISPECIES: type II toxin-antitoxin system HipA family toxin [Mumia]|uniref:type II toxin-antitoxin system HipA family toxin n=1 Tax=Mumia TaxID=1546255 RepID=UPI00141EAEE8|nr:MULTISPECIES: type II toxin-antitoxin system HipA family toxin [unclassified Mumia]QMW64900.1 type II toxin-antitoxin system HipA family toxin [Mumia sp. ZJ1417]
MTTSERVPRQVFVWVWLPGATEPVVAGRLDHAGDRIVFTYGRSYLERADALSLYLPELPLRRGPIEPVGALPIAGAIRDAAPDAWGRRVILAARTGRLSAASDVGELDEFTYLLDSGSNRIGALDFQRSARSYEVRDDHASLADLQDAAQRLDAGEVLPPDLASALEHGTSVGGARPKVLVDDGGRQLIAKLSSSSDVLPVVKAEGAAMELARRVGLSAPRTEVIESLGRDVLLVERFDRTEVPGRRRMLVSALTILGLSEFEGRYATYPDLAWQIRQRFTDPAATLRELFGRIVFNVCISNMDDHARNHAAFWDGERLTLTPAYDLAPMARTGATAAQAMAIDTEGRRESRLRVCLEAAPIYQLTRAQAADIVERTVTTIRESWDDVADLARLTAVEKRALWERQFLNPAIFFDDAG